MARIVFFFLLWLFYIYSYQNNHLRIEVRVFYCNGYLSDA